MGLRMGTDARRAKSLNVTQLAKLQGVDHIDIPQRVSAADRHRLVVEASPPHLGAFVGRAYARSITIAYVAASLLQGRATSSTDRIPGDVR